MCNLRTYNINLVKRCLWRIFLHRSLQKKYEFLKNFPSLKDYLKLCITYMRLLYVGTFSCKRKSLILRSLNARIFTRYYIMEYQRPRYCNWVSISMRENPTSILFLFLPNTIHTFAWQLHSRRSTRFVFKKKLDFIFLSIPATVSSEVF